MRPNASISLRSLLGPAVLAGAAVLGGCTPAEDAEVFKSDIDTSKAVTSDAKVPEGKVGYDDGSGVVKAGAKKPR